MCGWDGGFYGGGGGGGGFLCKVALRNMFPTWCQQRDQTAVYTTNIAVSLKNHQSYTAVFTFVEK